MKRREVFFFFITVVFLIAGFLYFHRTNQQNLIPHTEKTKSTSSPSTITSTSPPPVIEKEFKKSPQPECVDQTLTKLAKSCDSTCLMNHVSAKDPELGMMMKELASQNSKKDPVTKIGYFYKAFQDTEGDPKARENLLRFLVESDSDNAYPAFFLAELIVDEKPEEAKLILEQAVLKKNYESYYTEYFRRLKQATIDRPDMYARAILFNRELNVVQLNVSILWGLDEFDRELAKKVALKIIKPTLDAQGAYGDILWNREDYLFGRYMLEKSDSTEHALLPDYEVEDLVMDRYAPGLTDACSAKAFLEERARERQRLLSIPKS